MGAKFHDNNCANTVLDLFESTVRLHGLPSRVRGNHSTENIRVAKCMLELRGNGRGSYLWGWYVSLRLFENPSHTTSCSSVHNTRSEQLWFDLVNNLSHKWQSFFQDLETHHGMNAEAGDHIWLLHCLFLEELNCELDQWAKGWNHHKMQLKGEENKSPIEMFLIGMVEHETPGMREWINQQEQAVEDLPNYGVSWEDLGDQVAWNVVQDGQNQMPFELDNRPEALHDIICEPPGCPLSAGEMEILDATIAREYGTNKYQSMPECMLIWDRAFELSHTLVHQCEG